MHRQIGRGACDAYWRGWCRVFVVAAAAGLAHRRPSRSERGASSSRRPRRSSVSGSSSSRPRTRRSASPGARRPSSWRASSTHGRFRSHARRRGSACGDGPVSATAEWMEGKREEKLERAIATYERAAEVFTRDTHPDEWARTQDALGEVYRNRIRGDRADNLEKAIEHYEAALTVRTREAIPPDWALAQANLGIAYLDRLRGDRAESLEKAIAAHAEALTVRTREALPQEWATTQHNLARAYENRIHGNRAGQSGEGDRAARGVAGCAHARGPAARLGDDPEQPGQPSYRPHSRRSRRQPGEGDRAPRSGALRYVLPRNSPENGPAPSKTSDGRSSANTRRDGRTISRRRLPPSRRPSPYWALSPTPATGATCNRRWRSSIPTASVDSARRTWRRRSTISTPR